MKTSEKITGEEARGRCINRMGEIEELIDDLITKKIKPQDVAIFRRYLLNSSIINMGAKIKLLRGIELCKKGIITDIQTLSTIRNAFAHVPIKNFIEMEFGISNKGPHFQIYGMGFVSPKTTNVLNIMHHSGNINRREVIGLFNEFWELSEKVKKQLQDTLSSS